MRSFSRREVLAGLGLVAATPLLGACGGGSGQSSASAPLAVWKGPHTPTDAQFFEEQLKSFRSSSKLANELNYKVIPWPSLTDSLTAAFKGKNAPAIVYLPQSFYPQYAKGGALADLGKVAGSALEAQRGSFPGDVWKFGEFEGKQYGFPFMKGGTTLAWNRSLFRDAGLDPDTPPATWDELRTMAQKLTKKDAAGRTTQWGYGIMDNSENFMLNFAPVPIVNYGGDLTTPDDKKWIGNGEGHVAGLQLQVDIMRQDKTAPPFGTFAGGDINKAFMEGKIAMMLTVASFIQPLAAQYPNADIAVGHTPGGPANKQTQGGVGYWFMSEKTGNKKAAWDLISYLSSSSVQQSYAAQAKLTPTRNGVDPFAGDKLMTGFVKADTAYFRSPLLPFDYWQLLMPEVENALSGQVSAKQALDTAAERINQRIQVGK